MSLSSILDRLAAQPVVPRRKKRLRPPRFHVESLEQRALLSTITVNSTEDTNARDNNITLREAILLANGDLLYGQLSTQEQSLLDAPPTPGPNTIVFNIPGNGVQTIMPTSPLPTITESVTIDATTQPGYSPGQPLIDIDGTTQSGDTAGLDFTVGGNTVKGLIIDNFPNYGLRLEGTGDVTHGLGPGLNNIVQGNFIGTDASGKSAEPNKVGGIYLDDSSYNLIGGVNQPGQLVEGNLISGNGETGILVAAGADNHNYIEGNYIGTDITGLTPIANSPANVDGVALAPPLDEPDNGYASDNFIGNFDPRTNQYEPLGGNVISGNSEDGVLIVGGSGNQVSGNDVGVGVDGSTPLANGEDGVRLVDASANTIGGTQANSKNVISGNTRNGLEIDAAAATEYGLPVPLANQGASGNKIQGNEIGTDVSGTAFVPNGNPVDTGKSQYGDGIVLRNLATDPRVFVGGLLASEANVIGGAGAARNLISGNWDDGILLAGANVLNNTVEGNYIGTDKTGKNPLPNSNFGVELNSITGQTGAPSDNFIGTTGGNGGNLISGNGTSAQGSTPAIGGGVAILNGAGANTVQNNLIGTDSSGLKFLPNSGNGVFISSADDNTIGGDSDDDANIISGNDGNGVTIVDSTGNKVEKNEIGVGFDDATRLPNLEGIALIGATGNFIGGVQTIGGEQVSLGNVISANSTTGIAFSAQANSNQVLGNRIGTDLTGTVNLGNADAGISIDDSTGNQIGGTTPAARNLIVFNDGDGIDLENIANNGQLPPNVIEGDYIGVGPDGTQPEGNAFNGILILKSSFNTIGGTLVNVISGNAEDGVQVAGLSQSNTIAGNYVGTTADGNSPLPNGDGVAITAGASSTAIGGGTAGSNVISGNRQDGIYIGGAGEKNTITNSYIGLNASGTGPLNETSPQHNGVVVDTTPGTVIGADSFEDGGNVISGNQFDGIFVGGPSTGTQITGNYVGTDKNAARPVANGRLGIDLAAQSSFKTNTPSSKTTVAGNVISGNLQGGVALGSGTSGNHLEDNFIGTNSQLVSTIPNYGYGVYIANSPGNFIGAADAGNQIYFTAVTNDIPAVNGVGVCITGLASTGNDVADNDVFQNATAGIEVAGGASGSKIGNTQGNDVDANFNGIVITDSGTRENTVDNNYVGIDENNTPNIGNTHDGVLVTAGASSNVIGEVGAHNVISENAFNGIEISGDGTSDNSVLANDIGTDVKGNFKDPSLGNGYGVNSGGIGIDISAPNNHIGGSAENSGNLIAQSFRGIGLEGSNATGNTIEGNKINNNGDSGILVTNGASGNTIGGPNDADGNSICDNLDNGVSISSGVGDSIRHNTIYANGKLGIFLGTDAKGNDLQPAPLLSVTATTTRLTGWLQAAPSTTYAIEFFKGQQLVQADGKSEADDARGIVQPLLFTPSAGGGSFEIFDSVTTDTAGLALFDLTLGEGLDVGTVIRATATDPEGNTSQFSNPAVAEADTTGVGVPDNDQNGNSPSASNVSFRDALDSSLFINMQTSAGAFRNVWSIPNPSATDAPVDTEFSLGFADFTIVGVAPGQHLTVTMTLPVEISGPVHYWRYNLTTKQWYQWDYDPTSDTGAQIVGDTITLHFVDGGRGDDDGAANGTIVDPGSPGFPDPDTVTTTADNGPGSLRQAILNADANAGSAIVFDIPGSGPQTIQLLSPLPQITADITIDGSTQPGVAGAPLVELDGSLAGEGADGLTIAGGVATIKGLAIDRFSGDGIHVLSSGSARIVGNYLGAGPSGTAAEGNGLYGCEIENNTDSSDEEQDSGSPSTVDGGNVISGNVAGGIFIHGIGASDNFVTSNFIGTQADGVSPLGNGGPGVLIGDGARGNDIGFHAADEGNTIAFNAGPGVDVLQGSGNLIEANSIFANRALGIDLGGDGVTSNDPDDTDAGPNDLQNFPVLASAVSYGGRTFISGTLASERDLFYTIDFYASSAADPTGFGQGQFFLGSISVDTDDRGQASFDANLAAPVAAGSFITATACLGSNTSEFSVALKLTPTNPLVLIVNTTDDANDAAPDPAHFSLREAIQAANSHLGQDIIDFDLPNLDRVILPHSALPDIADPVIIDGTTQPGYQGLPLVEIDGSQAGAGADGLRITGGGSIVRGVAIHSFQSGRDDLGAVVGGNAIELAGLGGNLIEGDFLGTDVTGTRALPDGHADMYIFGSPHNVIGGTMASLRNVILSAVINDFNSHTNQVIQDAGGNYVKGNYIGVDLTGTAALPGGGLQIENSSLNAIGGTTLGAGNVIVGGIAIEDGSSNIVQGNLIGSDFMGAVALGGGSVLISGQGSPAVFNQIGGGTPAARNLIAGNVLIEGANSNENVVQGNYIGTDITGSVSIHGHGATTSEGDAGIAIESEFNEIGGAAPREGNVISGVAGGADGAGVLLEASASNNQIQGNFIGTDATGTKPLGNLIGIDDRGGQNLIGGPQPGEGNVISGNAEYGLLLDGTGGNRVQGNFIGTDRSGTLPLGNGNSTSLNDGIFVTEEPHDVIGGAQPGAGNVISANGGNGIRVANALSAVLGGGILIQGNLIGTDVTGRARLGNGGAGIYVVATPHAVIGGAAPGAGNVIVANGGDGVQIVDSDVDIEDGNQSSGAVIQANRIGTDATGTKQLGNVGDGVSIITSYDVASDETIGGPNLGEGNTVAFNGGRGVDVPFGSGNSVRGNDIFGNGGLGLITDINGALSTYAEDRGVNSPKSAPVLTSAILDPEGTIVTGSLTGMPFTRYEIDFFANDTINVTGFGDGQTYLESISVLVDDTGSVQFQIPLDLAVPIGKWITATATPDTPEGDTSMFSQPAPVIAADPETIHFASPNYLVTEMGGATAIVVTRTGSTDGTATVDYTTSDGSARAGVNYTAESGTLRFADGETSQTITIPIADDALANGDKDFQLLLSNANGASLGSLTEADVTIADSDAAGQIQFTSAAYPTVDKALAAPVFTITRMGGSEGSVSVDYRVTGGTAVGLAVAPGLGESVDADYLDSFGTVTFAPGQTTAQIQFGYVEDLIGNNPWTPAYRGPRTIELTLGNPTGGAALGALITSTLTIDDPEDQNGSFGIGGLLSSPTALESDGNDQIAVFRAGQLSATESVSYTTVDGTAKAGTNYVATSGTLTFQPGQTLAFIDVPILDDHVVDNPGDFHVVLSDPTGGALIFDAASQYDVTILDSDAPPPPDRLVVVEQSIHEASRAAVITVERFDGATGQIDNGAKGVLQVDYATSDGTAAADTDYTATSGTLMFSPGQKYATFSVPIRPGLDFPGDATFFVTLSNVMGNAVIGGDNPAVETIYGTPGQAQFAFASYPVAENNADLRIAVTLTPAPGAQFGVDSTDHYLPLTVDYSTHDGTATAGADYTSVSGTLSFYPYAESNTITIPILNDLLAESNETFDLTLSNPKGGLLLGDPATATITILDEDSPQAVESATTLTSDLPDGSTYGQTVTFTAIVGSASGTPTGSVDFVDSTTGQDLGSEQLAVVNGVDKASVTVSSLVAGSHTIVATYTSDSNSITGSHDSLTQNVAPATLTVAADNKTMVFGATVPALTDTITGFVNGDTASVVSGTASLSTTATSASAVGSYPITVGSGTLNAANYTFAFVNGTLTVTASGNAPVLTLVHDSPASATEGSATTLTSDLLETTDSDSSVGASAIVDTITTAPTLGTLADNGIPLVNGGSFSQQDIDDGSVTYQSTEEGADSFAFSVASGGASPITGALAITASDTAVVATGGFTYSATAGTAGTAQTVATFTDPGGAEALADYAATIDWGDGTSAAAGTLSVDPNTHVFTVSGAHTYAQDGTFAVAVTILHETEAAVTVTNTASIASATGTGEGGIAASGVAVSGYEFSALTGMTAATFTDANVSLGASDFSAVINWGDGTASAGSITLASGAYAVSGSHEYLDEGHYTIKINIEQIAGAVTGGTSAAVSATATIHEERLANGTVGTPDQKYIQEIYRDLFGRQPEKQGLNFWVAELAQGVPRQQVAFQMVKIASFEEFQHDTVAALYQQYLGRTPDAGGLAFWSAYLYDGGTIEGMSQALVSSPEYFQKRGGGTAGGFLNALFHDALGRQIEPPALTYFEGLVAEGASAPEIAEAVFASDEYHRLRVNSFFAQFLGRPANPGALAYFAGELDNGGRDEIVISQLLSSDEYYEQAQI